MKAIGDVPYIKIQHLSFDGRLRFDPPVFIDRRTHESGPMRRSRVIPGDVLINIVGPPLGQAAMVPIAHPEWNTNQAIAILRPVEGYLSEFLLIVALCPSILDWAISRSKATVGQHNLTLELVRDLPIPVPPLVEQAEIVRRVEALFALADAIEARVRAATARADRLPQAILSKAFKGELVPTEAELARAEGRTYETAGEMLVRVKAGADDAVKSAGRGRSRRRSTASGGRHRGS